MFDLFVVLLAAAQGAANPCTNGSFEALAADGRAIDWEILNRGEVINTDAHAGRRALRLVRPENDPLPETGLNRKWQPHGGEQGAMLDCVKGGMEFWYKAVSATNGNLYVMVIPMDATGRETGPRRAEFVVPLEHVGDGAWHRGRLKYDYSDAPDVKWVHFAARILGGAGEMLLDDIAYVETVGPLLCVDGARFEECADTPGECGTLFARVSNRGDAPTDGATVRVIAGDALQIEPAETVLEALPPDAGHKMSWRVTGRRDQAVTLKIEATAGGEQAATPVTLAPEMLVERYGPESPVRMQGDKGVFACTVRNTGHAIAASPQVRFVFPSGAIEILRPDLAPGAQTTFSVESEESSLRDCEVTAQHVEPVKLGPASQVVALPFDMAAPSREARAAASRKGAVLENRHVRCEFYRTQDGFGPVRFLAKGGTDLSVLGWMPRLSTLVFRDASGGHQEVPVSVKEPPEASSKNTASLIFTWAYTDADEVAWQAKLTFELSDDARMVRAACDLAASAGRELLRFDGPMVYALERDEAVFPGLEWLVGGEVSSSSADIEEGHAHQVRYVPHPNMITIPAMGAHAPNGVLGLLWNARETWDGQRDRPAAVFASPDRFNGQRAHLMGLQLPSVPEFCDVNTREAARPYPLKAGHTLRLSCSILVDGAARDALAAMDAWFGVYGIPEPSPLPRGSYEEEVAFSMRAYLESLWDAETQQWWFTKNGPKQLSYLARPPEFAADLLLGAVISPEQDVREACAARAREVAALLGTPPRIDALRPPGGDFGASGSAYVAGLLEDRNEAGLWFFDADHEDQGIFKGFDYHMLGPDNAVAVGTCAERTMQVLRYARIAGDWAAFESVRTALEYMATERVPRAAQVWEVPFHSPDVLAAAQAAQAYLEAYAFTGDAMWLDCAVYWARRGLPFLYFWEDPEQPFLLGASIPVLGASLMKYSWFGRPVQWNGLCLAEALLDLAEHDNSYPWKRIAMLIIHSAIQQQAAEGEDVALWPDSVGAIEGDKSAWVFSPRQILRCVAKLLGRGEAPETVILGSGRERTPITAVGSVHDAAWSAGTIRFQIRYPLGEEGTVVIANVSRPGTVLLDGAVVEHADPLPEESRGAWCYDDSNGLLTLRIPKSGDTEVRIEGVQFRLCERLSRARTSP
ncbi:MAG: hypothetical protein KA184_09825 [Candidatus Hydrogenedentes bacterium]|nr:hypothetical protein [Candidatus Hydrogenedentota bacterium]